MDDRVWLTLWPDSSLIMHNQTFSESTFYTLSLDTCLNEHFDSIQYMIYSGFEKWAISVVWVDFDRILGDRPFNWLSDS